MWDVNLQFQSVRMLRENGINVNLTRFTVYIVGYLFQVFAIISAFVVGRQSGKNEKLHTWVVYFSFGEYFSFQLFINCFSQNEKFTRTQNPGIHVIRRAFSLFAMHSIIDFDQFIVRMYLARSLWGLSLWNGRVLALKRL